MMRKLTWAVACAGVLAGAPRYADAVIVYGPQGRNGAPPEGSDAYEAYKYQGRLGAFSGTAIGPNLVLMAKHTGVGAGQQFVYQGVSYQTDPTFGGGTGFVGHPG